MKSAGPERALAENYGAFGAEYRFSPVEDTIDRDLRRLLDCWNEIRGPRAMPAREELSPRALGPSLRHVQMFEIVDGGRDFRCRLYGSGLTEVTGMMVTGTCMSDVDNTRVRERMIASLRRIVETQAPVRMNAERSALGHLAHRQVETIWLPLGDGVNVTHVLSGCVFPNRAAAA